MKRNMINKITDRIEKIKVWISNKKPSNKYLRIAYYFLTGLMIVILTILFSLIVATFFVTVIVSLLWIFKYLINFNDYSNLAIRLLLCLLFSLIVSLLGYFEFGKD